MYKPLLTLSCPGTGRAVVKIVTLIWGLAAKSWNDWLFSLTFSHHCFPGATNCASNYQAKSKNLKFDYMFKESHDRPISIQHFGPGKHCKQWLGLIKLEFSQSWHLVSQFIFPSSRTAWQPSKGQAAMYVPSRHCTSIEGSSTTLPEMTCTTLYM